MATMITNCWGKVPVRSLPVEHFHIFEGKPGLAYNHQAQLTSHRGQLIATWTMGIRDEEGPAEDMVFSVSKDRGETWSQPSAIRSAQPGRAAKTIVVSSGLRSAGDCLVAYFGHWDRAPAGIQADGFRTQSYEPDVFQDVRTEASISCDSGKNWTAPVVVASGLTNYMTPFKTQSGRIILPGNLTYPWTDDPMGLIDWHWSGVPGLAEGVMDNYFNMHELNRLANTGQLYNEACCYQLADGTLRMMLRNEQPDVRQLGVSESSDNGLSWSVPELTDYTDAVCRAHFGSLPDGRYFGMTCPNQARPRTPAILALSSDGSIFDKHYLIGGDVEGSPHYQGLYKHGRYGYPYLHVDDRYGYVIYSINKEDIGIGRFKLDDLQD